jgi:hypothetical protein
MLLFSHKVNFWKTEKLKKKKKNTEIWFVWSKCH